MLSRVRIRGYKTLEDAEARLGSLTVVLGPLGAGRSNLLEAVGLLARLASAERLERAFSPPHRGRAAECVRNGTLSFDADLELSARIPKALNARLAEREKLEQLDGSFTRVAERRLRYALSLEVSQDSGSLRLTDESLEALSATGTPRAQRKPFIERDSGHGRFVVRIERQGQVRYFGAGRRRTLLSEVTDLVYHPHPAAAREELLGVRRFAFEAQALRSTPSAPAADNPGFRGEDLLPFLSRLAAEEPETLRRIEEKLGSSGVDHVDVNGPAGTFSLRIRGEGVPFHLAPDGILKLLAIASTLESSSAPTVALFDEPEAGLDRAGLGTLARILRAACSGRRSATQVVVVTGSAELALLLDPASVLACRREPGRGTVLAPLPGGEADLFRRTAMEKALEGSAIPEAPAAPAAAPRRRARATK